MPTPEISPVTVQENKVSRPIIRPLDILATLHYGCTWMILAAIFALRAGYIGDYSDPIRPGTVAATVICGVACLVVSILIVCNDGKFTPDLD